MTVTLHVTLKLPSSLPPKENYKILHIGVIWTRR